MARYPGDSRIKSFHLAYKTIETDLATLCEYIDPRDFNKNSFSHRTYELFLRSCTESENLWKFILEKNSYQKLQQPKPRLNINDYIEIEKQYSFVLSGKKVTFAYWNGALNTFEPFANWVNASPHLSWYEAYNVVKHNREANFGDASLYNLVQSVGALFLALWECFGHEVFFPNKPSAILGHTGVYNMNLLFAVA